MNPADIEAQKFVNLDFRQEALARGIYTGCTFVNCDFSNANLASQIFLKCEFTACDLSLAKLTQTAFREATFRDCKMLGLHFETCNDFGLAVRFEQCLLDHASFYKVKLGKTVFVDSRFLETDFTESDLTGSVFEKCDLSRARFEWTNLEKADFSSSLNYAIDPEVNRIKRAKFSLDGLVGLLGKYDLEIKF